jgi:hypothetical protein
MTFVERTQHLPEAKRLEFVLDRYWPVACDARGKRISSGLYEMGVGLCWVEVLRWVLFLNE